MVGLYTTVVPIADERAPREEEEEEEEEEEGDVAPPAVRRRRGARARLFDLMAWARERGPSVEAWCLLAALVVVATDVALVGKNNGLAAANSAIGSAALREYNDLRDELSRLSKGLSKFKKTLESSNGHAIVSRVLFHDLPSCACNQTCVPLDWMERGGERHHTEEPPAYTKPAPIFTSDAWQEYVEHLRAGVAESATTTAATMPSSEVPQMLPREYDDRDDDVGSEDDGVGRTAPS